MVAGEADIGSAAGIAVVKAVESGMNVRIIGEQVRNEWQLVTPVSLKDPKQFDGKRVGYHAPITVTEALVKWMAQHYKITPNWMIIPGSDVRAEAFMRGQLDATPAEIGDVLNILNAKPGQFHVLISYAKTFPQLIGSMYFARADYLQKNARRLKACSRPSSSASQRRRAAGIGQRKCFETAAGNQAGANRRHRRHLQRAAHLGRQRRRRQRARRREY